MKALYVRKLFLWPRFQASVKEALEDRVASPADVRPPCSYLASCCAHEHTPSPLHHGEFNMLTWFCCANNPFN